MNSDRGGRTGPCSPLGKDGEGMVMGLVLVDNPLHCIIPSEVEGKSELMIPGQSLR